ncbi:MAG: TIGR02206 family membrane protein [Akkermansiaceae bacterium]|nr:TIGR02206 family membrane protein [Akkermansiaceae bacterium]
MLAAFELYGIGHVGALISLAAVAVLVVRRCGKGEHTARAKSAISLLAFCCFAAYPVNQAAWESVGGTASLTAIIPLHLCDVAAFLCGFALITRRALLCELSYFWGLAGTVQGLLTPNLPYDFPHPVFLAFFMQHGVVVITALLLPLGLGWRPRQRAWLRAFAWIMVYAVAATIVNLALGTNFGFLMGKPTEASLLDIMPPWPGYILFLVALAGLLFYLLELPFKKSQQK